MNGPIRPEPHVLLAGGDRAVLDTERLDDLWHLTPEGFHEIVQVFLDTADPKLEAMREAARKRDLETVDRLAHSMRGSSGNLGMARLSACCTELEERARSGATELAELAERALHEYRHARVALEAYARERSAPAAAAVREPSPPEG